MGREKMRPIFIAVVLCALNCPFGSPSAAASGSIPRSSNSRHSLSQQQLSEEDAYFPPWNPSQKIDQDGFLTDLYSCVPGEWEQEAVVGGRYSDLRKKSRFLFGIASHAGRIPLGGSLRSARGSIRGQRMHSNGASLINKHRPQPHHDLVEERSEYLMCQVRQVPGDGNCLFHSVSACLSMAENKTHIDMRNTTHLRRTSAFLREQAVDFLQKHPRRLLFLQGKECWPARELLEAAAAQFNISGEEYCHLMKQDAYWGGGPEIVALSNFLCRPIHVYKLASEEQVDDEGGGKFVLRRMACFGSPKFDRKEPLHILSADSRFPDISPGRQLAIGNHFLALFPYSSTRSTMRRGSQ
mmetsp:Transcript_10971/g.15809  ORF Transcript_10971/g.15809 Transcript_10971/m.15809 type:complete len:354 (-) Transcript_10971:482-1543(-)|eukprot:CAMPEP_0172429396 /NCGR_PEP_ID=MMETSP1064-20121228/50167_1 /TAXON_ID=202472 /ORGANISM="Aulacoseira subarctica , Strain CCAP 1002/5" /LENGTH=353 /DNA_ID=CAMNT_0013174763 /DNA_START=185 /DNA_END=1246 /DNA_ORIENTATION=+